PRLALEVAGEVHQLLRPEAALPEVLGVHQHHPALAGDAAVAVLEPVDGGVELIMAPDGHHHQLARAQRLVRHRVDGEPRLPDGGGEAALAGSVGEVETSRLADSAVVLLEPGN